MMYGVVISDAIQRGNASEMQQILAEARELHRAQGGDLGRAIQQLEQALKFPGGVDPRPLYGVPIHDAIRRGHPAEMQALLTDAEKQLHELQQGIAELRKASQGGGGVGQPMPYGVAISDAMQRNDRAEMQRLLNDPNVKNNPDLASAVKELQAALNKKA
jgi:Domain of unknown function (DUF1843).